MNIAEKLFRLKFILVLFQGIRIIINLKYDFIDCEKFIYILSYFNALMYQQRLLEDGIGISPMKVKMIENIFGGELPSHLLTLLNKLTSEEYAAPPAKTKSVRLPIYKLVSAAHHFLIL